MGIVALVIVENEIKKREVAAILASDTPEEESAERVALHEAVEQSANLPTSPDELALDGGQHKLVAVDSIESFLYGVAGLIHGRCS